MRTPNVTLTLLTTTFCGFSLAACQDSGTGPDLGKLPDLAHIPDLAPSTPKGVYTTTGDTNDNQLFIWTRAADGTLTPGTPVSTGGRGSGATALGSQGSLVFDSRQNIFLVANNGDNSVSMLTLRTDGSVQLTYNVPSGGVKPVSVTLSGSYVYVVNSGNNFQNANITGFQISGGTLMPIANSTKTLSTMMPGPAQVQFTPDGTTLVVTEKTTSKIDTFAVASGVAGNAMTQNSVGMTPFGFAFSSGGKLIVSEVGTSGQPGSASSYTIATGGALTPITSKLTDNQMAPCWAVVANNTAYLTNAASNNVSAYKIATDGSLTLLANGNSGTTGMHPTDMAVSDDNSFLYTLNTNDHSLSGFSISASDGSLTKKGDTQGAPMYAVGLVVR